MAEEKKIWDKTNQWTEELHYLISVINNAGLEETVKWGTTTYTYNGKNIVGIAGFKNYFAVWFYKGIFLKDEAGVLVNAQEGKTKSLRQWRFASKENVNEKLLLQYIAEAVGIEKEGLVIKPEKKEVVIPEFLQNELDNSPKLAEAYATLTHGKRKDYCEYIETAKQEKTKLSRFEKIKPMILQGIGLNDKYK